MPPGRRQPVFSNDGHLPEAILEVLAEQARERGTWMVPRDDFWRLPDRAAGAHDAQVEFIVLIANEGFVEKAYLLKYLTPPATKVNRVDGTFVGQPVPAGTAHGERALERR